MVAEEGGSYKGVRECFPLLLRGAVCDSTGQPEIRSHSQRPQRTGDKCRLRVLCRALWLRRGSGPRAPSQGQGSGGECGKTDVPVRVRRP